MFIIKIITLIAILHFTLLSMLHYSLKIDPNTCNLYLMWNQKQRVKSHKP